MHCDRHAWRVLAGYAQALSVVDDGQIDALACTAVVELLQPETQAGSALLITSSDGLTVAHACGMLARLEALSLRISPGLAAVLAAGRPTRYPGGLGALLLSAAPAHRSDVLLIPLGCDKRDGPVLAATAESISDAMTDALVALAAVISAVCSARRHRWTDTIARRSLEPVLLLEADGSIRAASDGAVRLLGIDQDTIVGALPVDLVHPDDAESLLRTLGRVRESQQVAACELRCRRVDGAWIHTEATATVRLGTCGKPGLVLRLLDVHERKSLEAELTHWVFHDPKTGLANRALLRDSFQRTADVAARTGAGVAVVAAAVDGIGEISEALGRSQGDRALAAVADRLRACAGPKDTVARLGGSEFAILAARHPRDAEQLARRVAHALREPVLLPQGPFLLHASVGLRSTEPGTAGDVAIDRLLHDADLALSAARRSAEQIPQQYRDHMQQDLKDRLTVRTELLSALQDGEFVVHYQPIVELKTRRLTGFEALLRWQHPQRGLIPPDRFIPHAEQSGLIVQLGAWVLEQACADIGALRSAHGDGLTVSVNISTRQLHSDDIITVVGATLTGSALPPEALCLELTESALANGDGVAGRLWQLRELGVRLALDDFGTGYAAYGQLQSLPFDTIKIDRSFTQHLGPTEVKPALARDMIRMGHSLGLKIVAEGIETAHQEHALRRLHCQYGQGYLYGRPMPLPDAVAQLTA